MDRLPLAQAVPRYEPRGREAPQGAREEDVGSDAVPAFAGEDALECFGGAQRHDQAPVVRQAIGNYQRGRELLHEWELLTASEIINPNRTTTDQCNNTQPMHAMSGR